MLEHVVSLNPFMSPPIHPDIHPQIHLYGIHPFVLFAPLCPSYGHVIFRQILDPVSVLHIRGVMFGADLVLTPNLQNLTLVYSPTYLDFFGGVAKP